MSLSDPGFEPPEGMEDRLDFWLSMEEWLTDEAIQIFAGMDPALSRKSRSFRRLEFESVIQLNWHQTPAVDDNEYPLCSCYDYKCPFCESAKNALLAYSLKCKEIESKLKKRYASETYDRPINWIERALSDGIEIPWFRWAKKRRLFFQLGDRGIALNSRQANGITEKIIRPQGRNPLSVIIEVLCSHGDINYQARGAAKRIQEMIEQLKIEPRNKERQDKSGAVKINVGTILTILKSIPIETTGKPLATKEINSRLIIIAALCDYSGIEHQKSETVQLIMELTNEIGIHLDRETTAMTLKKIPEALSTRLN